MDNNKPPVQPQPSPTIVQPAPSGGGGNKMLLWLVTGIIVIGLIWLGYLYMKRQKSSPGYQAPRTLNQTPTPESNLNNDLNSIDVQASEDADFSALDKDLQSL